MIREGGRYLITYWKDLLVTPERVPEKHPCRYSLPPGTVSGHELIDPTPEQYCGVYCTWWGTHHCCAESLTFCIPRYTTIHSLLRLAPQCFTLCSVRSRKKCFIIVSHDRVPPPLARTHFRIVRCTLWIIIIWNITNCFLCVPECSWTGYTELELVQRSLELVYRSF